MKIWETIENSTGLQFDPTGNVINLSNKRFTKNVYKVLNKNLNFVPTIKKLNKNLLVKGMRDFY